jgi:hypothetical protein
MIPLKNLKKSLEIYLTFSIDKNPIHPCDKAPCV